MEVKELGHLVLYVKNLERSVEFYGKVLGWAPAFPANAVAGEPATTPPSWSPDRG